MSQFTLGAIVTRLGVGVGGGNIIKGSEFNVGIQQLGVNPQNLFSNPKHRVEIQRQLAAQGVNLPLHLINRTTFNVRKV